MNKKYVSMALVAGVLWGTSAIFSTELSSRGFSSLNVAFMRNLMAAICMLCYCLFTCRDKMKMSLPQFLACVPVGISLYANGALYYAAMHHASISIAVVLLYTAPAIVMIYSVFAFRERFTAAKGVAVALVLVGTALVTGIIGGVRASLTGILLGVMSGIAYSIYNIGVKYQMRMGANPIVATTYCFIISALSAAAFGNPHKTFTILAEKIYPEILWCVALGIVTAALPYLLYTYAMKRLPAGVVASLGCVEPLTASLISFVLYKEPFTVFAGIGVVFILVSVFLLSREDKKA